jgi:hypothetical protein
MTWRRKTGEYLDNSKKRVRVGRKVFCNSLGKKLP